MSLADLLSPPSKEPGQPSTLDETLSIAAGEWTEEILEQIVIGLRAQRKHWNELQMQGSRKRAPSSQIKTSLPAFAPTKVKV
jgi:hypothetical protein